MIPGWSCIATTHSQGRFYLKPIPMPFPKHRNRRVVWSQARRKWAAYVDVGDKTPLLVGYFDHPVDAMRAADGINP